MSTNYNGNQISYEIVGTDIFNFKLQRLVEFNKLAAYLWYNTSQPTKYSYTVVGRTPDVDFTYSSDIYATSHEVLVIGLYANTSRTVRLVLEDENGIQETANFSLNTSAQDFSGVALTINVEIFDEEILNNTLGQGWLITSSMNGYDKNGDLRLCGPYPWRTNNMKTYRGRAFR